MKRKKKKTNTQLCHQQSSTDGKKKKTRSSYLEANRAAPIFLVFLANPTAQRLTANIATEKMMVSLLNSAAKEKKNHI
jgi:hypothetical protein